MDYAIKNMSNERERDTLLMEVEIQMKRIAANYGLTFERGNGKYSDNAFTFTGMKFTVKETSTGVDGAEAEFKRIAPYGFKDTYGKTILAGGKNLKIVGYAPKARKYPFIGEDVDTGKRYKVTAEQVRIGLMRVRTEPRTNIDLDGNEVFE